jgi:predicted  nucleic acid-binding Zn-ribbon protein
MHLLFCDEGFYIDLHIDVENDEGEIEHPEVDLPDDVNHELTRLEDKISGLETEVEELGQRLQAREDRTNAPCADALDKLWKAIMPENYGDWEYAGQAYRHLLCVYNEQNDKIKQNDKVKELEDEISGRDETINHQSDIIGELDERIKDLEKGNDNDMD